MKKNLAIVSTDWHIDSENVELSKDLAAQQIQLALDKDVKLLICLGDVFESRKAQPEIVLNCFKSILDMIGDAGLTLWCIAGNHDKTNPYSWESYLLPYSTHPALELFYSQSVQELDGNVCVFQSYIKEEFWVKELQKFLKIKSKDKKAYLFSHQAMNGSKNNDGSEIVSPINGKLLAPFEKCFFGHYHNEQQPLSNAYHLASWKQKNFGETDAKGFYVLYSEKGNLDVEFYLSKFPQYVTIDIEAEQLDNKTVSDIIKQNATSENYNIRVSIAGSTDELKSIPTSKLREAGIKVKTIDRTERQVVESGEQVQDFEKDETLVEAFKQFCEEREFDYEEGIVYLSSVIGQ